MTTPGGSNRRDAASEDPAALAFDWVMVPVTAIADAFLGLLHIRLPVWAQNASTSAPGSPSTTAAHPREQRRT